MTQAQKTYFEILLNQAHKAYKDDLKRYSLSKLSNTSLCEDLVQDTFVKTWGYLAKGGKILSIRSFLYRVLNDLIVDEYRKRKNVSLNSLLSDGFDPSVNETDALINTCDGRRLLETVDQLPEKYQKIISMRFESNMSIEEISETTGQSRNSVTVQVHRGIKKMRSIYDERETRISYRISHA